MPLLLYIAHVHVVVQGRHPVAQLYSVAAYNQTFFCSAITCACQLYSLQLNLCCEMQHITQSVYLTSSHTPSMHLTEKSIHMLMNNALKQPMIKSKQKIPLKPQLCLRLSYHALIEYLQHVGTVLLEYFNKFAIITTFVYFIR